MLQSQVDRVLSERTLNKGLLSRMNVCKPVHNLEKRLAIFAPSLTLQLGIDFNALEPICIYTQRTTSLRLAQYKDLLNNEFPKTARQLPPFPTVILYQSGNWDFQPTPLEHVILGWTFLPAEEFELAAVLDADSKISSSHC
ncbi:uncharacterized protein LOC109537922 [Dendroctonus ponderosae]